MTDADGVWSLQSEIRVMKSESSSPWRAGYFLLAQKMVLTFAPNIVHPNLVRILVLI